MAANDKKAVKTLPCVVDGCDGKIGDGSITGLCHRCYSSMLRAGKQTTAQRTRRALKLKLWETRLAYLLPDDKIQLLTTRKQYKPLAVLPGKVKQYRNRPRYKVAKK